MGCRVLVNTDDNYFCFACNTTDVAFGPLLYAPEGEDLEKASDDFRVFLKKDPRVFECEVLRKKWYRFCKKKGWEDLY